MRRRVFFWWAREGRCVSTCFFFSIPDSTLVPLPRRYDRANREVAILCNHQKTVPKAFIQNFELLTKREALLAAQVAELRDMAERVS